MYYDFLAKSGRPGARDKPKPLTGCAFHDRSLLIVEDNEVNLEIAGAGDGCREPYPVVCPYTVNARPDSSSSAGSQPAK